MDKERVKRGHWSVSLPWVSLIFLTLLVRWCGAPSA